jgi:hypothetical protein
MGNFCWEYNSSLDPPSRCLSVILELVLSEINWENPGIWTLSVARLGSSWADWSRDLGCKRQSAKAVRLRRICIQILSKPQHHETFPGCRLVPCTSTVQQSYGTVQLITLVTKNVRMLPQCHPGFKAPPFLFWFARTLFRLPSVKYFQQGIGKIYN